MKFTDRYGEFMKGQKGKVPVVQLNNLKAVLQSCEIKEMLTKDINTEGVCDLPQDCPGDLSDINPNILLLIWYIYVYILPFPSYICFTLSFNISIVLRILVIHETSELRRKINSIIHVSLSLSHSL